MQLSVEYCLFRASLHTLAGVWQKTGIHTTPPTVQNNTQPLELNSTVDKQALQDSESGTPFSPLSGEIIPLVRRET